MRWPTRSRLGKEERYRISSWAASKSTRATFAPLDGVVSSSDALHEKSQLMSGTMSKVDARW